MKISVVIPCFRAGDKVVAAVDSVLTQSGNCEIIEIIIIDDGSDDRETQQALRDVSLKPTVRIVRNNRRKGSAGARNTGIFAAKADWIAFLDADDWWLEGSLKVRCA